MIDCSPSFLAFLQSLMNMNYLPFNIIFNEYKCVCEMYAVVGCEKVRSGALGKYFHFIQLHACTSWV